MLPVEALEPLGPFVSPWYSSDNTWPTPSHRHRATQKRDRSLSVPTNPDTQNSQSIAWSPQYLIILFKLGERLDSKLFRSVMGLHHTSLLIFHRVHHIHLYWLVRSHMLGQSDLILNQLIIDRKPNQCRAQTWGTGRLLRAILGILRAECLLQSLLLTLLELLLLIKIYIRTQRRY
jgi:hypothetical protein